MGGDKKYRTRRVLMAWATLRESGRHYRKRFVAGLPSLRYLDDRPVFEDGIRCGGVVRGVRGGENGRGERGGTDMIKKIKQEKRDQAERRVKAFDDRSADAAAAGAAAEAAKTQPALLSPSPRRERAAS